MSENDIKKLELTWEWFKYHAEQRLRAFYYYLLIIGALGFAFLRCMGDAALGLYLVPFLCVLGILTSFAFLILEVRNVELVNIGREMLRAEDFQPCLIDYAHNLDPQRTNLSNIKERTKEDALKGSFLLSSRAIKFTFALRLIYYSAIITFSLLLILFMFQEGHFYKFFCKLPLGLCFVIYISLFALTACLLTNSLNKK